MAETPSFGKGVAMDIPVIDAASFASPPRLPDRLKKRMVELEEASPRSLEDIEAKLRHADLRRQQFYEELSRKAKPKARSPSQTSHKEKELCQRLEARLQVAEQNRLNLLAKAQMRLARLDELRQAAKSGLEMRFESEREKLGSKVESRVQQAEANRMHILKARQRRATVKERASQSLLRRTARENKYKECVRAAMHQKRAAAERKRLGLLEAEKKRAHARVLHVQWAANSVSQQQEIERRKIMDQLEDRLQRAKRQRAEYLRRRARQRTYVQLNWMHMQQADLLSRKLARCWEQFRQSRRTTLDLVKEYDVLKINENSVKSMPFEQLQCLIESTMTIRTVKALLDRLESRYQVYRATAAFEYPSGMDNIDHLLKRVATLKERSPHETSKGTRDPRKIGAVRGVSKSPARLLRYPVKVFLCAYMILGHPDAVFSNQGELENALAKSAEEFVREFELLTNIILNRPIQSSVEESGSMTPKRCTFRLQLAAFDRAWCSYLKCFVAWTVKDAEPLEEDLVTADCELELSMIKKCNLSPEGENDTVSPEGENDTVSPEGENDALTYDMKAIQKRVTEDQQL